MYTGNFSNNGAIVQAIADHLRLSAFETILTAESGHVGACSSSAELMAALYFGPVLRYDPANPRHPERDRVLVRGHLGPLRYSLFSLLGWVEPDELKTYRRLGSRLQGHESMDCLPGVDITPSGSLGMLLSYGVGCAYVAKLRNRGFTTYVFLGDGEEQEGNISEAARHAASLGLDNLVCIVDQNTKQLSAPTSAADGPTKLGEVWSGYGWDVKRVNGHKVPDILSVLRSATKIGKPTLIIAETVKGRHVQGCEEHFSGYHTLSTCGPDRLKATADKLRSDAWESQQKLGQISDLVSAQLQQLDPLPDPAPLLPKTTVQFDLENNSASFGEALGSALREIVRWFKDHSNNHLYMLTADWSNYNQIQACNLNADWISYIDVGIREQHMMAMAHGISVTDPAGKVFVFDGDGFAYRGSDQLHAMCQAKTPVVIIGTDSGLSESKNGSTHQSAGQPGMLAHMPNLTLIEPATEAHLYAGLNSAFNSESGPVYIRVHSGSFDQSLLAQDGLGPQCFYEPTSPVSINLVVSGLVLREAVEFARNADQSGVGVKVVNVVTMQNLDEGFAQLLDRNCPTLTAFNGMPSVLHGFVASCLIKSGWSQPVLSHGFTVGTTGDLRALLRHYRLDAEGLRDVCRQLLS